MPQAAALSIRLPPINDWTADIAEYFHSMMAMSGMFTTCSMTVSGNLSGWGHGDLLRNPGARLARLQRPPADSQGSHTRGQECLARVVAIAANLRPSILNRAFEGRLEPQDPADKPASVLLERIKAERNGGTSVCRIASRSRDPVVQLRRARLLQELRSWFGVNLLQRLDGAQNRGVTLC